MTLVSKYSNANSRYWGTRHQNGIVTVHPFTRINEQHTTEDNDYIERDQVRDIDTDLENVFFLNIIENLFDNFKELFYETNVGPLVRLKGDALGVCPSETTTSTSVGESKVPLLKLGSTSHQPVDATAENEIGNDVGESGSIFASSYASSVGRRLITACTTIIGHPVTGPETGNVNSIGRRVTRPGTGNVNSIDVGDERELGAIYDGEVRENQGNSSMVEENIDVPPTNQTNNYKKYISYAKNKLQSFFNCFQPFQRKLQNHFENIFPIPTHPSPSIPSETNLLPNDSIETLFNLPNFSPSARSLTSNPEIKPQNYHQQTLTSSEIFGGQQESASRTNTWVTNLEEMENCHRTLPNTSAYTSNDSPPEGFNVLPPRSSVPQLGLVSEGGDYGELQEEEVDSSDSSDSNLSIGVFHDFTAYEAWIVVKIWFVLITAYLAFLFDVHNVVLILIHMFILPEIELFSVVLVVLVLVTFVVLNWKRGQGI